ncbi:MAG: hypothetical protein LBQ67_06210 [Treponema sp.]|nr:hypothetical protein [Treponema sp.]
MKFRYILIIFNIFLFFFAAVLCLIPFFTLGSSFSLSFWLSNWYLLLAFVLIPAAVDGYYVVNRRLLLLLEKEDWPALVYYLEEKVIRRGKYTPHLVRLLANAYLVLSDSAAVISLEKKIAIARPDLLETNALLFGAARILGRDIPGAVRFFSARLENAKPPGKQWLRWYYGFSLLRNRQPEKAAEEFSRLAAASRDGVVAGLASFFLDGPLAAALPEKAPAFKAAASEGRNRVRRALPGQKNWTRETGKLRTEIYAAALSQYMDEAGRWLYGNS